MTDNIVPFKRPDTPPPPENPLYFVTLYQNSSIITDPNHDEVDRVAAAEAIFDNAFHVLADTENAHVLIAVTDMRNITFRQKDSFDTPAQRAWLARRLDDVYETCTGKRRHPIRQFFANLFRKGPTQ